MNIIFNDTYQLEAKLSKVDSIDDLYHLTLDKRDLVENTVSRDEHFFNFEELKQFVSYLNKATSDYI